jgi:hypothetical protein
MQPSSPLSAVGGIPGQFVRDSLPDLLAWNGRYDWDNDSLSFFRTGQASELIIGFPVNSPSNNSVLTLSGYSSRPSMQLSYFPAEFTALMESAGKEALKVSYKADFQDEWPLSFQCELTGDGFAGMVKMNRTRNGDSGTLDFRFSLNANGFTLMEGTIKTEIGYNGVQIFFRRVEPYVTIFDTEISGHLDYGLVDPTSQDYIRSFNDNCHIIFSEAGSGKKIGDFGLGRDKSGELLEWVVYLSDGSQASLYDYLLVFKKFMDYKYPNKKQTL